MFEMTTNLWNCTLSKSAVCLQYNQLFVYIFVYTFRTKREKEEWLEALFEAIKELYQKKSSLRLGREILRPCDSEIGKKQPHLLKLEAIHKCMECSQPFSMMRKKYNCRACGVVSFFTKFLQDPKSRQPNIRSFVQGDPNQNCPFLRAITLKLCVSDPMLVKPKCVWEAVVFFWKIVNKQLKNVNKFSKIEKNYRLSNTFWLYQYRVKNA